MGDQWTDPLPEIKRTDQAIQHSIAQSQAGQLAFAEYNALWKKVAAESRAGADLVALGAELRHRGHGYWLDVWLMIMRRRHKVSGRAEVKRGQLLCAETIRLLKASMTHDERAMDDMLANTYETVTSVQLENPFIEAGVNVRSWGDAKDYPHSPYVTRQELVRATRGMRGLSASSICRAIKKGQMTIDEPKGEMAMFRHLDGDIHVAMLRAIMNALSAS
jgi:hypothetical protein